MEMLTADKARELTKHGMQNKNKEMQKKIEAIFKQIREACDKGASVCMVYEYINPEIIDFLKSYGYSVSTHTDMYNETTVEISWY